MNEIPRALAESTRKGDVVLILGSGASLGATGPGGKLAPTTQELTRRLCMRFLSADFEKRSLTQVSDLAISESSLIDVQTYIRDQFEGLEPTKAHSRLTRFRWWGLATTNYDRLIEKAYIQSNDSIQEVCAIASNGDEIDRNQRDPNNLILLKLHGCISRISTNDPPLILGVDQYVQYRENRRFLFDTLLEWAYSHPIVFIGQSVQDPDLREVLLQLHKETERRGHRNYIVTPSADAVTQRFWETKKTSILSMTFDEFMNALDTKVPHTFRELPRRISGAEHPILARSAFPPSAGTTLSEDATRFLDIDVEYLGELPKTEQIGPYDFYRGAASGWSAVEQELDVRRSLTDEILEEVVLESTTKPDRFQAVLIKAHAGSGKSVLLRRVAWEACRDFDALCLFAQSHGRLEILPLLELLEMSKERVFLFVDDAADYLPDVARICREFTSRAKPLTLIMAERTNEWNVTCATSLDGVVDRVFELPYLSEREIDGLIALLEKHNALGHLANLTQTERRSELKERAGRQLLVALHEATLGRSFEDIIEDEYNSIVPDSAKRIYLTVCTLHRLGVSVRAGLISRLHGITIEDFKARLFAPLEHVVYTEYDSISRDHCYTSRHSYIAEMVFSIVLRDPEDRFDLYIRCLKALNLEYDADSRAFRRMVRGRAVNELFHEPEHGSQIYSNARKLAGEDPYLFQQMAIYEMNKPFPDLEKAAKRLQQAATRAPQDLTIKHSSAELHIRLSGNATTKMQRDFLLEQADKMAREVISAEKRQLSGTSFAHHTRSKIAVLRVEHALNDPHVDEETLQSRIKEAEKVISDALQRYPSDSYILHSEAGLASLLSDSERAVLAMTKGFNANPRNGFLASRLSTSLVKRGRPEEALVILKKALDANRGDRRLHLEYARTLHAIPAYSREDALYHLQKSFLRGDRNFQAQLLFARELYLAARYDEAREVFEELSCAKLPSKSEMSLPADERFLGRVVNIRNGYLFLQRDDAPEDLFCHRSSMAPESWDRLRKGTRVSFRIGFNMRGPVAFDLSVA